MILFTNKRSSRLDYIIDFAWKLLSGEELIVSEDFSEYKNYNGAKVNYSHSRILDSEIWIMPHSLLFETGITEQKIECFGINGHKAFFKTEGSYPFDIFAASFYLLSRYEEYLPYKKDEYCRYAHTDSLAYKEGFLDVPLVNIWMAELRLALAAKFPNSPIHNSQSFSFTPTYDIDEAWSYKNKKWWRNAGGAFRDVLNGNFKSVVRRISVLTGRQQDPYDTYDYIETLNVKYSLNPVYFFLAAERRGKYDKNISPDNHKWKQLVGKYSKKYKTGIHPSWRSGDEPELLKKEITTLERVSGKMVICSRQHYIRLTLPQTYRKLIEAGIAEDYSMGYGSINGFRASVAIPFYWYDLEKEQQTPLLIFPFCFMDANSYYEQKQTIDQSYDELIHYYRIVKSVDGTLITIWHNNFFGTDKRFEGWKEIYARFLEVVSAISE